jgi:hypothetical protein
MTRRVLRAAGYAVIVITGLALICAAAYMTGVPA